MYVGLIELLLVDDTVGVVCKPKARDLFKRLADIEDLLEEAMATGRLLICDDLGTYPAVAGLMADVAIGELVGTTAGLEAYLAGVPSLLIDAMDMDAHPYYAWGKDTVVFANWTEIFAAVAQYRADPNAVPGFGDWGPIADDLDPFRDGQARVRMGEYMTSLLRSLRDGAGRRQAIESANENFAEAWGAGAVRYSPKETRFCCGTVGTATRVGLRTEIGDEEDN